MRMTATLRPAALLGVLLLASSAPADDDKGVRRLAACREVLEELLTVSEGIPRDLLHKAECVAVIPSAKKLALGLGARYGKGALLCRGDNGRGPWGPPLILKLEAGSYGLQIGGEAADLVLLVMNPKGVTKLLESKLTLGADAAVAAGPVGRSTKAATDIQMKAEILSYSRSRGVFAGLSLEGAVLHPDDDANERLYGARVHPKSVLLGDETPIPVAAQPLVDYLRRLSPTNLSGR